MRKLIAAVFFMSLGAVLMTCAFAFHFVRGPSGHVIVWKVRPSLKDVYADVRVFKPDDWKQHRMLAKALQNSRHKDLAPKPADSNPVRAFFDKLSGDRRDEGDAAPPPISQDR